MYLTDLVEASVPKGLSPGDFIKSVSDSMDKLIKWGLAVEDNNGDATPITNTVMVADHSKSFGSDVPYKIKGFDYKNKKIILKSTGDNTECLISFSHHNRIHIIIPEMKQKNFEDIQELGIKIGFQFLYYGWYFEVTHIDENGILFCKNIANQTLCLYFYASDVAADVKYQEYKERHNGPVPKAPKGYTGFDPYGKLLTDRQILLKRGFYILQNKKLIPNPNPILVYGAHDLFNRVVTATPTVWLDDLDNLTVNMITQCITGKIMSTDLFISVKAKTLVLTPEVQQEMKDYIAEKKLRVGSRSDTFKITYISNLGIIYLSKNKDYYLDPMDPRDFL